MANLIVLGGYLVGVLAMGAYLSRYVRRDEDYFLAGRSLNKWVIAGTVMATNVAAIWLVGPAGQAYKTGVSVLLIAWSGNMIAAVSALVFVPRLRRLGITTISEFLEERYGLWLRLLPAVLWMVYYTLFAGTAMYTFALTLRPVLEESGLALHINLIILIVGLVVIAYCFLAGLLAVAYTDVVQAFLIILGGLVLLPLALKAMGGVSAFADRTPQRMFVFWRSAGTEGASYKDAIMWILMGLPYWCTSQYMLQRSFAGRSVRDASRGLALAALLTGVLTLSYIVPGVCGHWFYDVHKGAALRSADGVLPRLFVDILPLGLGGLFVAALVAASNSTASSLMNSIATLAEHDVYRRFTPGQSGRHYTRIGRLVTVLAGLTGILFAFFVPRLGGIKDAIYAVMGFFEPPIFVVVAAALFWRRANVWGAAGAIVAGMGYSALAQATGTNPVDRALLAFPICIAALVLGTAFRDAWQRSQRLDRDALLRAGLARAWTGLGAGTVALAGLIASALLIGGLVSAPAVALFAALLAIVALGAALALPAFRPGPSEDASKVASLFDRMRQRVNWRSRSGWAGLALAAVALAAFVGCALGETYLPKPANILIFMGLMTAFVGGCYLAIPMFVPAEPAPRPAPAPAAHAPRDIQRSWINRIFGSGWAWLALYVGAGVLMVALYFLGEEAP